ncbi:MAG: hypothetical protein LBJ00_09390 [Planctomycetaceae bacterium]|jgi:hypothetical protein|nr:hypothetical protein [Planctomycetaceae bacterium]
MFKNTIYILFTTALIFIVNDAVYAEKHKDVQSLLYEFEDGGKVDKEKPVPEQIPIQQNPLRCCCPCKPVVFAPVERCCPRYPGVIYSNMCPNNTYYYSNNIRCVPYTNRRCYNYLNIDTRYQRRQNAIIRSGCF